MNDRQMRDLIRQSAEDVEIPESLRPENIEKKLKETRSADKSRAVVRNQASGKDKEKGKIKANGKSRRNFYLGYAASAAVLLFVCGVTLFFGGEDTGLVHRVNDGTTGQQAAQQAAVESSMAATGNEDSTKKPASSENKAVMAEPKENAGDLYTVASDYGQVYDVIEQSGYHWKYGYITNGEIEYVLADVPAKPESSGSASASLQDGMASGSSSIIDMQQSVPEALPEGSVVASTSSQKDSYSKTNLQTEGVDESDIIKTDGSYLYIVRGDQVHIVDIRGGEPKEAGILALPSENGSAGIREIYVSEGEMIVISQESSSKLKKIGDQTQYYTVTTTETIVYTYSLKNPASPSLLGSVSQDGYYHTSRKIGDKVYLFTNEYIGERMYGLSRDSYEWIPLAGGEKIASDCIYIPESGGRSLIISSIDTDEPEKILDNVMIVNNSVNIYVSTAAVYLYHTEWKEETITEIAKFSLEDGIINAVGAGSVKGSVTDTFALNESKGMLRILTNDSSRQLGSSLYILDNELKLMGKLDGIAPGETVYAARYLGDMAYFVTYRNVDPLFAADLSDPSNPKILGELKITGYSEYLHMWKDGTMFGIGYETDPDSGARKGIKLSMFDVSDPVNLQVLDSVCVTNADYSPALDQYKTVLGDVSANMIGFVVTDYNKGASNTYLLFEWKDGEFKELMTKAIDVGAENVRGIYSGDYFYIVSQEKVLGFDREDGYKQIGEIGLE